MRKGIIIINKSPGMTSHDIVMQIRRIFKMRRVGHAGTLDPMATGVLIILIGEATKLSNKFVAFDKAYRASLILGTCTNTADTQGKITQQLPYDHVTENQISEVFKKFVGEIDQVPPMVSAVKVNGKKLYELARQGIEIERLPRKVRIDCLKIESIRSPEVQFYMECSKGTYVRQLAEDVGRALGCGACISRIERTRVGDFSIENAVRLEDVNESHIRDWQG